MNKLDYWTSWHKGKTPHHLGTLITICEVADPPNKFRYPDKENMVRTIKVFNKHLPGTIAASVNGAFLQQEGKQDLFPALTDRYIVERCGHKQSFILYLHVTYKDIL